MRETTLACPKCSDGELTFEIEFDSADDGEWCTGGFLRQDCTCELSEAEIEDLETEVAEREWERRYEIEP
jgi:hypothetical protein